MTPTPPEKNEPTTVEPKAALSQWRNAERVFAALGHIHWSDTTESAALVDLVPNPKRYLVGEFFGYKLALDCGEPGVHIGK